MDIRGVNLSGVAIRDTTVKGTLANPGVSAQDIYNSGQTSSGWYYIKTSTMGSARQVYCNMTDESGGWMLIAYTPGFLINFVPVQWISGSTTARLSVPRY
jgi:hypothetical protein